MKTQLLKLILVATALFLWTPQSIEAKSKAKHVILIGLDGWGSRTPELPSREVNQHGIFPTMFQLLRDAQPKSEIGCLYEWDGIKYLVDTLSLSHYAQAPDYK